MSGVSQIYAVVLGDEWEDLIIFLTLYDAQKYVMDAALHLYRTGYTPTERAMIIEPMERGSRNQYEFIYRETMYLKVPLSEDALASRADEWEEASNETDLTRFFQYEP